MCRASRGSASEALPGVRGALQQVGGHGHTVDDRLAASVGGSVALRPACAASSAVGGVSAAASACCASRSRATRNRS